MSEENGKADVEVRKSFLPGRQSWREMTTHLDSCSFAGRWPALFELLAKARNEEGHWRAGASLIFFAEGGKMKASIYDRATQSVCFVTIDPDQDWLTQVEESLERGVDWRPKKR